MVSAMDCTCAELTGTGSDVTAASRAFFMMLIVPGWFRFEDRVTGKVSWDFNLNGNARHQQRAFCCAIAF
jgi:hypothetical protein